MIDVLVRADVHIFSLAILAVVFFTLRRLSDTHAMQTRLFRYMIGTTALILAACAASAAVVEASGVADAAKWPDHHLEGSRLARNPERFRCHADRLATATRASQAGCTGRER